MKESAASGLQIRNGYHSRNFAKMKFDFFIGTKQHERKRSAKMANSQWLPFAKFRKNKFRLRQKRRHMMENDYSNFFRNSFLNR